MALASVKLICPDCNTDKHLWIYPREHYLVRCKQCGMEQDSIELNKICTIKGGRK